MRSTSPPSRAVRLDQPPVARSDDPSDRAPRAGLGPAFSRAWSRLAPDDRDSLLDLTARVKAELYERFERGERAEVLEYLGQFPRLLEDDAYDRVVSLVYEEYCLREDRGESLDPDQFCDRYEPWRDSVISQLRHHRELSRMVALRKSVPRFPEPGETFQGYPLLAMLGQGGMARVFLAVDTEVAGRHVALKVSPDLGNESKMQGRLDHDHIVPVLSVTSPDPDSGLRGLSMPYRAGSSLDAIILQLKRKAGRPRRARALWDALRSEGESTWEAGPVQTGWIGFPARGTYAEGVAWVILTVARALEHAHSNGVLHLDIKPGNVLLTFREGPQLLDFNLSSAPHDAEHAEAALRGGTLPYMAPEQLRAYLDPDCWEDVEEQADLYALGLLLVELLTGRRPESSAPGLPLPRAVADLLERRQRPITPRQVDPTVPNALEEIAGRCLAPDPADRYDSATEMAEDLERFLQRRPLRHAPNSCKTERVGNWFRRNALLLALAAGLILLAFLIVANQGWRLRRYNEIFTRAQVLKDRGDVIGATALLRELIRLDPKQSAPYVSLGLMLEQKDPEAALGYLDTAVGLSNASPTGLRDLYVIYWLRSKVATKLGQSAQGTRTSESFDRAAGYYRTAAADHARAEALARRDGRIDALHRMLMAYGSALIRIGEGDVASARDDHARAIALYEQARRVIDEALALSGVATREGGGRSPEASLKLRDMEKSLRDRRREVDDRLRVAREQDHAPPSGDPASPTPGLGPAREPAAH